MTVTTLPTRWVEFPRDDRQAVLREVVEDALGPYAGKATLTIEEVASVLGVGRSSAYTAAASGDLPVVRIGRRVVVPTPGLVALLLGVRVGAEGPAP